MAKWIILAAHCLRIFFFHGHMKANGVILEDTVNKIKSSNALVAWAFTMQNGLSCMLSPVVALIMPFINTRQLSICGGAIVGIAYIVYGLAVNSIWQLFFVYCASGIGYGFLNIVSMLAVKDHFPETFPAMASLASLFTYVGIAIVPSILQLLKDAYGFRESLVLFGAMSWNLIAVGVCMKQKSHETSEDRFILRRRSIQSGIDVIKDWKTQLMTKHTITDIFMRIRSYFSIFVRHKTFTVLVVIECLAHYVYLSWALFLVSLGREAGLSPDQSVLLSTAGGCGGFWGTLSAVFLHHGNLMNAYTSSFIPLLLNSFFLLGSAIFTDLYYLLILVFLSGFCLGLNTIGVLGLIPSVVCCNHYPQALAITYFADGFMMQLGGILSGLIYDCYQTPTYIFGFDALTCFLSLPLVVIWICMDEIVANCN